MIFIPSRGRRESLERFFRESKPRLAGRVLIDTDDVSTYDGMKLPDNWKFSAGERVGAVGSFNRGFYDFPNERYYGVFTDDAICAPLGWDETLAESCQPASVSWGDDGRWQDKICTAFFVGGELAREMGWLLAPVFGHLYADRVWSDIAHAARICNYHPGIQWRHDNVHDRTYQERKIAGDRAAYYKIVSDGTLRDWMDRAVKLNRKAA